MKKLFCLIAQFIFSLFPHKPIVAANIQRILVIKLCCIGDILFTTPLLRALKTEFPRSQITYMVCSWCRELAAADPCVHDIIEFNAYDQVSRMKKIKRAWQVIREIRRHRFDLALVLHRTPWAGVLTALGGVPIRIGFDWEKGGFAHTHRIPFRAEAHEIDRYLDCLQPLGIYAQRKEPELQPPPAVEKAAAAFLNQHGYNKESGPLIAVFPAGGVNPGTVMTTKRWSLAGYQSLCQQLINLYHARILLVGNQDDIKIGDQLVADQPWGASVIRSEGKTSLLLLAALLRQCTLFIGGDSGPLHMADAVGIPTVSLFGPTDPKLLAPRGQQHRVINKLLPCSPCYNPLTVRQADVTVCREQNLACMQNITSQEVLGAVEELLSLKGYHRL